MVLTRSSPAGQQRTHEHEEERTQYRVKLETDALDAQQELELGTQQAKLQQEHADALTKLEATHKDAMHKQQQEHARLTDEMKVQFKRTLYDWLEKERAKNRTMKRLRARIATLEAQHAQDKSKAFVTTEAPDIAKELTNSHQARIDALASELTSEKSKVEELRERELQQQSLVASNVSTINALTAELTSERQRASSLAEELTKTKELFASAQAMADEQASSEQSDIGGLQRHIDQMKNKHIELQAALERTKQQLSEYEAAERPKSSTEPQAPITDTNDEVMQSPATTTRLSRFVGCKAPRSTSLESTAGRTADGTQDTPVHIAKKPDNTAVGGHEDDHHHVSSSAADPTTTTTTSSLQPTTTTSQPQPPPVNNHHHLSQPPPLPSCGTHLQPLPVAGAKATAAPVSTAQPTAGTPPAGDPALQVAPICIGHISPPTLATNQEPAPVLSGFVAAPPKAKDCRIDDTVSFLLSAGIGNVKAGESMLRTAQDNHERWKQATKKFQKHYSDKYGIDVQHQNIPKTRLGVWWVKGCKKGSTLQCIKEMRCGCSDYGKSLTFKAM